MKDLIKVKGTFGSYHPIINFSYFLGVIGFGMFVIHPIFLIISFVGSLSYAIYLGGRGVIRTQLIYSLPLCLAVGLMNPLFNHEGMTIITYIGDNPLTLESIYYGELMALLFLDIILWFYCYNYVMTSDKLIYLLGCKLPTLGLIFSMTLRFIPLFKKQFQKVIRAQKGIGNSVKGKNILGQLRWGIKILSIVTTWILENAIDTANSMKSRGYGLKGRTSFSNYQFKLRDISVLMIILLCIVIIGLGILQGEAYVRYFPTIKVQEITEKNIIIYLAYGVLCLLPLSLHIMEDIKWHYLK